MHLAFLRNKLMESDWVTGSVGSTYFEVLFPKRNLFRNSVAGTSLQ